MDYVAQKKAHRVSGDNPDEKQPAMLSGGMLVSYSKTSKRRLNPNIKDIRFTLNYDIRKTNALF